MSTSNFTTLQSSSGVNNTARTVMGDLQYAHEEKLYFPEGIIGFPDYNNYIMIKKPTLKVDCPYSVTLLQSLERVNLCFLLTPYLKLPQTLLIAQDIQEALENTGMSQDNANLFFILNIIQSDMTFESQKDPTHPAVSGQKSVIFTINLRAPVIIDQSNQIAFQHVFSNRDYPLKYRLK